MQDDEQVFDFLAAAEDTGKQLDALIKAIPGEIRETLAAEYRKSPWLATLPATADRVTTAGERAEAAARVLTRKSVFAGWVVCMAAVVVPLATWGYAYWQTAGLRNECAVLEDKIARLAPRAATHENASGGGTELVKGGEKLWMFILPRGAQWGKGEELADGRNGYWYSIP